MTPKRVIVASHLIFTGYAHWLSNDLRGSGSTDIRKEELKDLGPIHFGRKIIQPARQDVREFYDQAKPLLDHEVIWFNEQMRNVIAQAFADGAKRFGYTIWAFAVCSNHAHAIVRTHRDRAESIWQNLAFAARDALRASKLFPENHPVWSNRPYKVFIHTGPDVVDRKEYVDANPQKEGLPRQDWDFIVKHHY